MILSGCVVSIFSLLFTVSCISRNAKNDFLTGILPVAVTEPVNFVASKKWIQPIALHGMWFCKHWKQSPASQEGSSTKHVWGLKTVYLEELQFLRGLREIIATDVKSTSSEHKEDCFSS